jgi:hypothetical protein
MEAAALASAGAADVVVVGTVVVEAGVVPTAQAVKSALNTTK